MGSRDEYSIHVAEPNHLPQVLQIMQENWYYEEPTFASMYSRSQLTNEEKQILHCNLDELIATVFRHFSCLIAIHNRTSRVAGAVLTVVNKNPKFSGEIGVTKFCTSGEKSNLLSEFVKYFDEIYEQIDIFRRYPEVTEALEIYAIAVDKNHRQKGLTRKFLEKSIALCKILKIPIIFGIFTSLYSIRAVEKIGMKSVLKIDLPNYRNENGEVVFPTVQPHDVLDVRVLEI